MSARDAFTVVMVSNNGQERLLLSRSPDLIPPLEVEPIKGSWLTPAPARNALIRQHAKAKGRRFDAQPAPHSAFGSFAA